MLGQLLGRLVGTVQAQHRTTQLLLDPRLVHTQAAGLQTAVLIACGPFEEGLVLRCLLYTSDATDE